jgi:hypothetical protein
LGHREYRSFRTPFRRPIGRAGCKRQRR